MDQVSIRGLRILTLKRHLEHLPMYFYGEIGAGSNSDTLGESMAAWMTQGRELISGSIVAWRADQGPAWGLVLCTDLFSLMYFRSTRSDKTHVSKSVGRRVTATDGRTVFQNDVD